MSKTKVIPPGGLATNANPLVVDSGALAESKNVVNDGGVIRRRNGLEIMTESVFNPLYDGSGPPRGTSESWKDRQHRIINMMQHNGKLFAIACKGSPDAIDYTDGKSESDEKFMLMHLNENSTYSYWNNPANYGTSTGVSNGSGLGWQVGLHKFSYRQNYDGYPERVPDMVSTRQALIVSSAHGAISVPTMVTDEYVAKLNNYTIPNNRTLQTDAVLAGAPDAFFIQASTTGGANAWMADGVSVAYRCRWVKRTPAQVDVLGHPSDRYLVTNKSGADAKVSLSFPIPQLILDAPDYEQSQYFLRLYRTDKFPLSETGEYTPPDEVYYAIDDIYPISTDITTGAIGYYDILSLKGPGDAFRFSSDTLPSIGAKPPISRAIGSSGDRVVYGDIRDQWAMTFNITGVSDPTATSDFNGLRVGSLTGNAFDGDIVCVDTMAFALMNTGVSGVSGFESIKIDYASTGLANVFSRLQQFSSGLATRVNAFRVLLKAAGYDYSWLRDRFLKNIGSDASPYAALELSCLPSRDPIISSQQDEIFGQQPVISTSFKSGKEVLSPPSIVDSDSGITYGKAIRIKQTFSSGNLFNTSEAHNLSVGDEVMLSISYGGLGGSGLAFTPGRFIVDSTPSTTVFSVAGGVATDAAISATTGFVMLGAVTMVKRNASGATHACQGTREDARGGIAWSLPGSPEQVPYASSVILGRKDAAVLAIREIAGTAFVFKEDGLWKGFESYSTEGMTFKLFDADCRLIGPHAICQSGGELYAWTTRGVARISETSVDYVSQAIDDQLRYDAYAFQLSNHVKSHMVAHSDLGHVMLWTVSTQSNEDSQLHIPNKCYVYDGNFWQVRTDCASTALVMRSSSDYQNSAKLITAAPYMSNYLRSERQDLDVRRFADERFVLANIARVSDTQLLGDIISYSDSLNPLSWADDDSPFALSGEFADKKQAYTSLALIEPGSLRLKITFFGLSEEPSEGYYTRVRISVDGVLPATISSAHIMCGYESGVKFIHNSITSPEAGKQFSEYNFLFEQPYFGKAMSTFATDVRPAVATKEINGFAVGIEQSWPWILRRYNPLLGNRSIRDWIPRDYQRATQLQLGFVLSAAYESFGLLGYSLTSTDESDNNSRRNNG
jgi:hypothetical protein